MSVNRGLFTRHGTGLSTRREWLAAGGLALAAACRSKKKSGYRGYALVATAGEESLAVVDLTSFELLEPILLHARPATVMPGGPADHIYALTPATGTVHMISPALEVVRARKLGDQLSEIRLTPDGKRLLAVSSSTRELIEADAASLDVLRRYRLAAEPVGFDVPPCPVSGERPKPPYAAVSTGDHGLVELFDLHTGQHRQLRMSGSVGAIRFRADGERLLVARLEDRCLTALTSPTLEVIADLPLAMKPQNLCFNSDQGQLFVSGEGMDGIAIVFPYTPLEVEQTVLAGRDPGVMACCGPAPAFLFVGNNSGSDVCIMNIDSRKVIGIVDVGQRPTYITVTPDNQYALILNASAGSMAVIHISAIRLNAAAVRSKSGASLFTVLPVGDNPVHAAVVPRI